MKKNSVIALVGASLLAVFVASVPSAVSSLHHSAPAPVVTTVTATVTAPVVTVTLTPATDVPAGVPEVAPPVVVPVVPAVTTYTVRDGDTLSGIAFDFYGHADRAADIASASGVTDVDSIFVGQVLVIP